MAGLATSQMGHKLTNAKSFAQHRFGSRSSPGWSSRRVATRRPNGRSKCALSMRGALFCQLRDQRVRHPCTTVKKILQSTVSKLPREHEWNFHVDDSACHVTDDGTSYFYSLANERPSQSMHSLFYKAMPYPVTFSVVAAISNASAVYGNTVIVSVFTRGDD